MRRSFLLKDVGLMDLAPCDAGQEDCEPKHKFGPNIRNYYLVHFVVSGEGRFETPRGEYRVGSGEAFLIKPGELSVYEADAVTPWEYLWLGFKGNLAERFSELPDVFAYDEGFVSELLQAAAAETGKEALYSAIALKLYAKLAAGAEHVDYPNRVKGYINAHYMENVTIAEIAESLGLNRKYLARIFKEANGVSMQEFLINKRLHEAKKLLMLGYNVEESAYMVGYADPFGFSKAFKKRYGYSPIKYKNT